MGLRLVFDDDGLQLHRCCRWPSPVVGRAVAIRACRVEHRGGALRPRPQVQAPATAVKICCGGGRGPHRDDGPRSHEQRQAVERHSALDPSRPLGGFAGEQVSPRPSWNQE